MRNVLYTLLTIIIVISALIVVMNWNSIIAWWNTPDDGDKCILANEPAYIEGVISNGQCIYKKSGQLDNKPGNNSSGNSNPKEEEYDLQVSNPNGAYMYYQSLSKASGGMIYGKSNLLIPYGKKFKLVNTWQTNSSVQPFSGYYETNYKEYGPNSGFFATQDIIKLK